MVPLDMARGVSVHFRKLREAVDTTRIVGGAVELDVYCALGAGKRVGGGNVTIVVDQPDDFLNPRRPSFGIGDDVHIGGTRNEATMDVGHSAGITEARAIGGHKGEDRTGWMAVVVGDIGPERLFGKGDSRPGFIERGCCWSVKEQVPGGRGQEWYEHRYTPYQEHEFGSNTFGLLFKYYSR